MEIVLLLMPIAAAVYVLRLRDLVRRGRDRRRDEHLLSGGVQRSLAPQRVPCPACAEAVLPNARRCPYCREVVTSGAERSPVRIPTPPA